MPSRERENVAKLECAKCKRVTHFTNRNKKTLKNRLEMKKYCRHCRAHTAHKETK